MFLLILGILLMVLGSSGLAFARRRLRRYGIVDDDRTHARTAVWQPRIANAAIAVASLASIVAGLATAFV
ncbi:MAG TPA: hypothetical protein VF292_12965 [Rhodanobacteraceae bacterium]